VGYQSGAALERFHAVAQADEAASVRPWAGAVHVNDDRAIKRALIAITVRGANQYQ
jgi:hypothetical protein